MDSARRAALQDNTLAAQARGPSIPRAPRRAATQAQAEQAHRVHGQALALAPVLARRAQAGHRALEAVHLRQAKHLARHAPHQEAAADARSIPRRRKAR